MRLPLAVILTSISLLAASCTLAYAQDYVATPVSISKDKVKQDGKIYYAHVVLERQTLYSIAKAYGVSLEEIYAANPAVQREGLKNGSILLIPYTAARASSENAGSESAADEYIYHTVKWNDTLWSISQQYGVSVDDIIAENQLTDTKIKKKQQLRIPHKPSEEATQPAPAQEPVQSLMTAGGESEEEVVADDEDPTQNYNFTLHASRDVSMALLLPLQSGGKRSSGNIDFYCGVLMALSDLRDNGISTRLSVFDTSAGNVSADKLSDQDLILGPIAPEAIRKELPKCPDSTPVISPLNQKVLPLTEQYANLIQAPVPLSDQYRELACWIAEDYRSGDNILLISDPAHPDAEFTQAVKAELAQRGLKYKHFTYGITQGRTISNAIAAQLSKEQNNRIVVLNTTEAFLSDAIRNLNVLSYKNYDITLYAPSKVRDYDTAIESEALHNLHLHMTASYHIDYNDSKVMHFILRYRALYNTEPSRMAFQGYDAAYYFISMYAQYGIFLRPFLQQERRDLLQSSFQFSKTDSGSLVNHAVRRVVYDKDFSIRSVQ